MSDRPLIVLCPHFAPDTAPTGVVMTRIVEELVALGHTVHVVTSLPWYRSHRIENGRVTIAFDWVLFGPASLRRASVASSRRRS